MNRRKQDCMTTTKTKSPKVNLFRRIYNNTVVVVVVVVVIRLILKNFLNQSDFLWPCRTIEPMPWNFDRPHPLLLLLLLLVVVPVWKIFRSFSFWLRPMAQGLGNCLSCSCSCCSSGHLVILLLGNTSGVHLWFKSVTNLIKNLWS